MTIVEKKRASPTLPIATRSQTDVTAHVPPAHISYGSALKLFTALFLDG
jgi:hypothetical protein